MKVTVCELHNDPELLRQGWEGLVAHVRDQGSELVLLPEMGFAPWFPGSAAFDSGVWQAAVETHAEWLERLPELSRATVLGSRPVNQGPRRLNEAFIWQPDGGYRGVHAKYYLPDETGFWEASWYQRGTGDFVPVSLGTARVGFQVCTELWFLEESRRYGKQGIHIVANPRGTELATGDKWLVAGRAAAVLAGAFCLSSNRVGPNSEGGPFGGMGWVIDPDGQVLALTSEDAPFATVDIDLQAAEHAKATYPRYVHW